MQSNPRILFLSPMRCHQFDLAAELESAGIDCQIVTAYPKWKLKHEKISTSRVHTFPWIMTPKIALNKYFKLTKNIQLGLEKTIRHTLDWYTLKHIENCDIFESLSSFSYSVGQRVQKNGGK